ncbi:UDP-N-acetylmuramate--L-alanine ligase, partial [Candidatus Fermentibacteria bacterium]|nr:UDP-N-acetylmuramate--L-alanine ligase [Candidatus Fermentibacteria bacterium]
MRVHLMGVSGSGMSGMALWYRSAGHSVSGCDREPHDISALERAGIEVFTGHDPAHSEGADLLVHTAAIAASHPEIERARSSGRRVLRRSEALAELCAGHSVLAVAGAHGKTTTTAMTGWALQQAGLDPTVLAGGVLRVWGSGFRPGGRLGVVEADEYDRTFLRLPHRHAAVTSFDAEHLECYGSIENLLSAFQVFLELCEPGGGVVVPVECPELACWAARIGRKVLRAGPGGDFDCRSISAGGWGERFLLGGEEGFLPMPGLENLRNASTCIALLELAGVPPLVAMRALESYPGVARRLERIGSWKGGIVISDYAHHPREIEATLSAVRRAVPGRIIAVFEPHLYSRTASLATRMGEALCAADEAVVLPIFAAREEPVEGVDSSLVAEAAAEYGC